MSSRPSGPDYPWRLRIEHEGAMSLRLDRRGRPIRIDPNTPPGPNEVVILTGVWPEHLDATREAVRSGSRPTVVAPEPVLQWLSTEGELDGHPLGASLDGLTIEQRPYTPIPYVTPKEAIYKVQSALLRPDRAARRLLRRAELPKAPPVVTRITLGDGATLVHAALSIHSTTPDDWFDRLATDWAAPEWLILGVDHGHGAAVVSRVGRLAAKHILVTDFLSEMRRRLGFPTELLTPVRDRMVEAGLPADVFVSGAGLRYE